LLGLGLQYKTVDDLAEEFNLIPSQLLGLYNRMMRRILQVINGIMEQNVHNQMPVLQQTNSNELRPLAKPLDEELDQAAKV
jgi:N-acetyltransferase 10